MEVRLVQPPTIPCPDWIFNARDAPTETGWHDLPLQVKRFATQVARALHEVGSFFLGNTPVLESDDIIAGAAAYCQGAMLRQVRGGVRSG